jgi:hypothetical protein
MRNMTRDNVNREPRDLFYSKNCAAQRLVPASIPIVLFIAATFQLGRGIPDRDYYPVHNSIP